MTAAIGILAFAGLVWWIGKEMERHVQRALDYDPMPDLHDEAEQYPQGGEPADNYDAVGADEG